MNRFRLLPLAGLVLLLTNLALAITPPKEAPAAKPAAAQNAPMPGQPPKDRVLELDWDELLPKKERETLTLEPPPPAHGYLDESGPAARQYGSAKVNPELNNVRVKIPGFVVPLEMTKNGIVSEFLLVPYFGACIHVPPPPPNQIVHVRMKRGISLDSIYDPQWITGRLTASTVVSRFGSAAYSLAGEKAEPYDY